MTMKTRPRQRVSEQVSAHAHAHAADSLYYSDSTPYNQMLIGTLRLEPACYMLGAPLNAICKHFRQHYAQRANLGRMREPRLLRSTMIFRLKKNVVPDEIGV